MDAEVQKESFIARNMRVKPSHSKAEKGRNFENSPVSGHTANLEDNNFSEEETENSKNLSVIF